MGGWEGKEIVNGDTGPPAASVVESKTIGGHARHWVHAIPPLCSSQPTSSTLSVQDGYQQSSGHEIHEAVVMIQRDNDAKMRNLQGGRVRTVRRKGIVS